MNKPDSQPTDGSVAKRCIIRTHRVGDIGWAIERHGQIYADEFGWNSDFEALVATLFAKFATTHDPATECFWVAELDGERIGGVFVVRNAENPSTTKQLRHPNGPNPPIEVSISR